ncbi:MAG: MgtC/SapB family protein [Saprospiraceae bacterium]
MNNEILLRILLAALWGGIIGAEREYRNKSAGFRTMIMISTGACLFTIFSSLIGGTNNSDRIAANIVTGIGFLGAGVIFRGENRVKGLTTAAAIWVVSAVGMGIGGGYYFIASSAGIMVLVVLVVLPYLEHFIDQYSQFKTYRIKGSVNHVIRELVEDNLRLNHLKYDLVRVIKGNESVSFTWLVHGNAKNHRFFIQAMLTELKIESFEY